jgi:multicomponent Na+:H+ antiporter subunit G
VSPLDWLTVALLCVGALFFLAGTVGLLRFPDVFTRLHAVTKADNLGLGFVVVGISLQSGSVAVVLKLILIWVLCLIGSATSVFLIASSALRGSPGAGRDGDG